MAATAFPSPRSDSPPVELSANFEELGLRLRCRAQWELVDWVQDVFDVWSSPEVARHDGSRIGFGFNVYELREDEPGGYTILVDDYRDPAGSLTDDLSEALWIHSNQSRLWELTGTTIVQSRMDHVLDVTPAARALLGTPGASVALYRVADTHVTGDGTTHTGWTIVPEGERPPVQHGDAEPMHGAHLAHLAPALATALALPPGHLVTATSDRLREVWTFQRDTGTVDDLLVRWAQPAPPARADLATVRHTAHGVPLVASVAEGYEAEALDVLRMFDQFPDDLRDNFGTYFAFWWVVLRHQDGELRAKITDLTEPGLDATTEDLTALATSRRAQAGMYRALGDVPWRPVHLLTSVRVYPGALDVGPVVLRREEPADDRDSGWVIGSGTGEFSVMPGHDVYRIAPAVVDCFWLPVGYAAAVDRDIVRVVDPAGRVRWPHSGSAPTSR